MFKQIIACEMQEEDDLGDMMYKDCIDELRKQAKQLGYKLIKIKKVETIEKE